MHMPTGLCGVSLCKSCRLLKPPRHWGYLLLLLPAYWLGAQSSRIEYFTVTDGLSTREVTDLHIGQDGYLWVATLDGLNRFDGHGFLTFGPWSQAYEGRDGLSRGSIKGVARGNDGRLVLTFDYYGFFDLFDPRDFSVEQIRLVPGNGIKGYPRAVSTDNLGRTFVVSIGQEGTYLYEHTGQGFKVVYHQPDDVWLSFAPQVELLPLSNGQFLLYDEQYGIRHLSASGEVLYTFFEDANTQRRFYTMAEGPKGYVYISFRDGIPLFRWHPSSPERHPVPVPNMDDGLRYTKIFEDGLGQLLFLATEDILSNANPVEYYLADTAGNFQLFERDLPAGRTVTAVAAQDFRRTAYLGLYEGLGVMERYVKPIENYMTVPPRRRDLYRKSITGITEDDSARVYFLTEEGRFYVLPPGGSSPQEYLLVDTSGQAISLRDAHQLVYDERRDAIWGVAQRSGLGGTGVLFRYGVAERTTMVYEAPYDLECLTLDRRRDRIYLGATDPRRVGLLLEFAPEAPGFTEISTTDDATGQELRWLRIDYLTMAEDGRLLIGTLNRGLVSLDPEGGRAIFYNDQDQGAYAGLTSTTVYCIYEDPAKPDQLYLGTDAGLYYLNDNTGEVTRYGRQQGLSNNNVIGIVPDSSGGLWLSTFNGLVHVPKDPTAGAMRRYYREDGLANDKFNRYAFLRSDDGRYFFGGPNGVCVFRDEDLSQQDAGSDIMLTEIVVYGRTGSRTITQNLDQLEEIIVEANEKSLAISFAIPVGQRPRLTQLRVKLEGFSEEWRELRNERTVRYNNLLSGNYRLLVQAAGANGNYGEQTLVLAIDVRQYVIERTWFQVLVALLIAGLFFFILQARLKERLRNEQLRTQLSSDIHDEVSGLLAGITLQTELLQHKTEDEKLQSSLQRVGQAGRMAMSKMSDVIWSIDSRRDTIGNLLQRMQEHADEVLLPLDIRYEFSASGLNEESQLAGNIRQDLYFIYKEAINNIARHSDATLVEIELEQFAQTFEMFIRDNGNGGNPTSGAGKNTTHRVTAKTGQGTENMRMRAQRLGGELTIDNRVGYTLTLRTKRIA